MGEEIWGFRIAEILVKCEIKGIFIGLNFTDSGKYLDDWLSMAEGIEARYRFDSRVICPHIFIGEGGYPQWDPKYRYGEHPQWESESFCQKYICDIENIFRFISNVIIGGN